LLLFFQWKGRNDIVYSYCIAAEELLMDRSEKSPARSSRLNKNTAPIDAPNEMLNLTQAADVNLAAKF
jgi:hypothetical protein